VQKSEPAAPKAELAKKEESATKVVTLPKVDYATELFNLLCMDDSRESDSTTPAHDNGWASFQSEFLLLIIFMKEIIDTWILFSNLSWLARSIVAKNHLLACFFTNNLFSGLLAAADAKSTPERSSSSNFIESMTQPNLTSPSLEKPLKAVNNDIMNLFDKVYILKKNAMIKYGSGY